MDNQQSGEDKVHLQQSFEAEERSSILKTISIGLGVIGIGLAIGIGGYFLGVKNNKTFVQDVRDEIAASSPTPLPTEVSTKEGDPTADWKSYTSADYSIKFPPSWEYASTKQGITFGPSPLVTATDAVEFVVLIQNKIGSLPTVGGDARSTIREVKKINIDGVEGAQAISVDTSSGEETFLQTVVIKDGNTYYFSSNFPEKRETYDQILSTFRFSN